MWQIFFFSKTVTKISSIPHAFQGPYHSPIKKKDSCLLPLSPGARSWLPWLTGWGGNNPAKPEKCYALWPWAFGVPASETSERAARKSRRAVERLTCVHRNWGLQSRALAKLWTQPAHTAISQSVPLISTPHVSPPGLPDLRSRIWSFWQSSMKPVIRFANSTTYWMAWVIWMAHCCHSASLDFEREPRNERGAQSNVESQWHSQGFPPGAPLSRGGPKARMYPIPLEEVDNDNIFWCIVLICSNLDTRLMYWDENNGSIALRCKDRCLVSLLFSPPLPLNKLGLLVRSGRKKTVTLRSSDFVPRLLSGHVRGHLRNTEHWTCKIFTLYSFSRTYGECCLL